MSDEECYGKQWILHPEEKSDQGATDPTVNQELVDLDLRSTFHVNL